MRRQGFNDEQQEGVLFTDLQPNDTVVVETMNSTYRFVLKDVDHRMGSLEGGRIDAPRDAVAGGVVEGDRNAEFFPDGLRPGGRAVFFIVAPRTTAGFDRILTSDIERVFVDRSHADRHAA
jgi:hypothetical protein